MGDLIKVVVITAAAGAGWAIGKGYGDVVVEKTKDGVGKACDAIGRGAKAAAEEVGEFGKRVKDKLKKKDRKAIPAAA
jgi:hypothetical protein